MSETTFENAKIGDRVYSPLYACKNLGDKTNAVIVEIDQDSDFKIRVKPDIDTGNGGGYTKMFMPNGQFFSNGGQTLFWENPIRKIPTRPTRTGIKKGWIGIYPTSEDYAIAHTTCIYRSKEDIEPFIGVIIKEIEFEVEE